MSFEDRVIVSSAPGRCGIIGNPTDMYGGSVLSCSVSMRATATLTPADSLILEAGEETCEINTRDDLRPRKDRFDLVRAILEYQRLPDLRCRIRFDSDIPMQSGMAGSTALVVALLQGILAWQGVHLSRYRLAERARYIELNHLKVVCGYQDAYMTTFGGLNYMDFRGKQFYRDAEAELFATVESLDAFIPGLPFVLAYTGVRHSSGGVHKPLRERWLEGESKIVQSYERIGEIARLGKKALLNAEWPQLGSLMNENHAIQRELGGSGEANEILIQAALDAGALGAKLAGAGDGGTIIALWPNPDIAPLETALRTAGAVALYRPVITEGAKLE
ncbi:MAG: hypothetical protein J5I90_14035 [Caldilineales bacterium]|nr:hypothetical protein [Caldilineales bacterium]